MRWGAALNKVSSSSLKESTWSLTKVQPACTCAGRSLRGARCPQTDLMFLFVSEAVMVESAGLSVLTDSLLEMCWRVTASHSALRWHLLVLQPHCSVRVSGVDVELWTTAAVQLGLFQMFQLCFTFLCCSKWVNLWWNHSLTLFKQLELFQRLFH